MIAVTGATGYIAQALLGRLRGAPTPVIAISRSPAPPVRGQERWVHSADGVPRAGDLAGCEALVHLAGRAHVTPGRDPAADQQAFDEANHRLAVRTAAAAAEAGVRRFVFVSTLGVHGNWSGEPITADSPLHPDTPYASAKLAAETELQSQCALHGIALSIVRPPMVYGPRCPGNFARLARLVRRGFPLPFASIDATRSFVGVDNLADFLVCAAALDAPTGTFAVGDGSDWALPELLGWMADGMQRSLHLLPFPVAGLRLAASCIGRAREMDSLTRPLRVDAAAVWQLHAWQPPIDPAVAVREAAASFGA